MSGKVRKMRNQGKKEEKNRDCGDSGRVSLGLRLRPSRVGGSLEQEGPERKLVSPVVGEPGAPWASKDMPEFSWWRWSPGRRARKGKARMRMDKSAQN